MRSAMRRAARAPPGVAVPRPSMLSSASAESSDMAHAESRVGPRAATGAGRWPPQAEAQRRNAANMVAGTGLDLAAVVQRRRFIGRRWLLSENTGWRARVVVLVGPPGCTERSDKIAPARGGECGPAHQVSHDTNLVCDGA